MYSIENILKGYFYITRLIILKNNCLKADVLGYMDSSWLVAVFRQPNTVCTIFGVETFARGLFPIIYSLLY